MGKSPRQFVPDFTASSNPDFRNNSWGARLSTVLPPFLVLLEAQLSEKACSPLLLERLPDHLSAVRLTGAPGIGIPRVGREASDVS